MKPITFMNAINRIADGETLYKIEPIDWFNSVYELKKMAEDGILYADDKYSTDEYRATEIEEKPVCYVPITSEEEDPVKDFEEQIAQMGDPEFIAMPEDPDIDDILDDLLENGIEEETEQTARTYKGKKVVDKEEVLKLKAEGWATVDIANKCKTSVKNVYNIVSKAKKGRK